MRRIGMLSLALGVGMALLSVLPPGGSVVAQEKKDVAKLPTTAPPAVWGVSSYDSGRTAGTLVLERQRPRAIMQPFNAGAPDDEKKDPPEQKGRGGDRAVNMFAEKTQINLKDLTVTTVGGTKVEGDDRKTKLQPGTLVIYNQDGREIDPAFLALYKAEVLIVTGKKK